MVMDFDPSLGEPQTKNGFLGEALRSFEQRTGGGRPTTKQGQDFILDFMEQYGSAPSPQQVADFKQGLGPEANLQYLPGSPMAQMGFANREQLIASRIAAGGIGAEEGFGPGLGALVPQGGLVITQDGVPSFRTFDLERHRGAISRGEFVQPPGGQQFDLSQLFPEGAPTGIPERVPGETYYGRQDPFQEPAALDLSDEAILVQFGEGQLYKARLQDYIAEQKVAAFPELRSFQKRYESEIAKLNELGLSQYDYDRQVEVIDTKFENAIRESGIMTDARAKELLADAENALARGITGAGDPGGFETEAVEGLPLFGEVQGVQGDILNQLIQEQRFRTEIAGKEARETAFEEYQAALPPEFQPPQEEIPIRTGTEERDYYGLIQGLGLAREIEQYMMGRFGEFLGRWMQSGPTMPFLDWLSIQMGG